MQGVEAVWHLRVRIWPKASEDLALVLMIQINIDIDMYIYIYKYICICMYR